MTKTITNQRKTHLLTLKSILKISKWRKKSILTVPRSPGDHEQAAADHEGQDHRQCGGGGACGVLPWPGGNEGRWANTKSFYLLSESPQLNSLPFNLLITWCVSTTTCHLPTSTSVTFQPVHFTYVDLNLHLIPAPPNLHLIQPLNLDGYHPAGILWYRPPPNPYPPSNFKDD